MEGETKQLTKLDRGGIGQMVVNIFTFYSDYPSSNPDNVYSFC